MEGERDEARVLKIARALSYINFSSLESWYGHPGFIKIFQGLKESGPDLGWALVIGGMERALLGDRSTPPEIYSGILKENRVTILHLLGLFPQHPPIRLHGRGFRIHGLSPFHADIAPHLQRVLERFGKGELGLEGLGEELYRLHTSDMRDSLYYHALLAARAVRHPVSAHLLWKAVTLLPSGGLGGSEVERSIQRLELCQKEQLSLALLRDPRSGSARLERYLPACPGDTTAIPSGTVQPPVVALFPGAPHPAEPTPHPEDYMTKARRFLKERGVPEWSPGSPRFPGLEGLSTASLERLLAPFLLRCFSRPGELIDNSELILAVGPPEVDKLALLRSIAGGLGLIFKMVPCHQLYSRWAGETESKIIAALSAAREEAERGGAPAMVVFPSSADLREGRGSKGLRRSETRELLLPSACGGLGGEPGALYEDRGAGGSPDQDVILALAALLTGPRKLEALGASRRPVLPVATAPSASVLDSVLRSRLTVVRFDPPSEEELERLLIQNVVGRYLVCDFERVSFASLASEARGLMPADIAAAARAAKLRALQRRARELGTSLSSAPPGLRERIRDSYIILEEDLRAAIRARKGGPAGERGGRARELSCELSLINGQPRLGQARLYRWSDGEGSH
ncbi:MAG: hypothetical protein QXW06_06095 [Thermoplasmata archaeon]